MKEPVSTLLLVSGLLKVAAMLLMLLMFAKLGWDLASGRQAQIPSVLLIAIGAIVVLQFATWAVWRYAMRGETGKRDA